MNGRIKLSDIRDYIGNPLSVTGIGNVHVGTCYDREYINAYTTTFPAIWIAGQKLTPADGGQGFSGNFRQKVNILIPFRIVIDRYSAGEIDPETGLTLIFDALADKVKDYKPTGAYSPFVWQEGEDGPATESLLVADQYFKTQVIYQRQSP